jgi:uncharacterized protein
MKRSPRNPLIDAVFRGSVAEADALITSGADPNVTDSDGRTPLMHAAIDGQLDLVRLLLKAGADSNRQDRMRWTALHFAAQGRKREIVEALIEGGSVVDARDAHGNTPLWRAIFASEGEGDLIRLLKRSGADPELKNGSGVSPRDLAGRIANYDLARFLES